MTIVIDSKTKLGLLNLCHVLDFCEIRKKKISNLSVDTITLIIQVIQSNQNIAYVDKTKSLLKSNKNIVSYAI